MTVCARSTSRPKNRDAYVIAAVPALPAETKLRYFNLDRKVIEGPVRHLERERCPVGAHFLDVRALNSDQ